MKRFNRVLVMVLALVIALCAFSACSGEEGKVDLHVVDASGEVVSYSVDTTGKELATLQDFLDYIADKEEFAYTESGGMVLSVNGITADFSKNEFWAIYTDVKVGDIPYYDSSWGTATVNEVEYASASKGIAELPLSAGATYVFKISTY